MTRELTSSEPTSSQHPDTDSNTKQLRRYRRWLLFGAGSAVVLFCANMVPKRLSFGSFYQTGDIDPASFPLAVGGVLIGFGALLLLLTPWQHRLQTFRDRRSKRLWWVEACGPSAFAALAALLMLIWNPRELPEAFLFEPPKIPNNAPLFAIVDSTRVSYLVTYERDPRCEDRDASYSTELSGIAVEDAQRAVLEPLVQALTACSQTPAERGMSFEIRGYASSSHGAPAKACRNPCEGKLSANACIATLRARAVAQYLSTRIDEVAMRLQRSSKVGETKPVPITVSGIDNPGIPNLLYADKLGVLPQYQESAGALNRRVEITIKSAAACNGAGDIATQPRPEHTTPGSRTAQVVR